MRLSWPEWAVFFAVDEDSEGCFYEYKPLLCIDHWMKTKGRDKKVGQVILENVKWLDSLLRKEFETTYLTSPMKYTEVINHLNGGKSVYEKYNTIHNHIENNPTWLEDNKNIIDDMYRKIIKNVER